MNANDKVPGPPWSARRIRAADMLASGISIERVSMELGLSSATARRYEAVFAQEGRQALIRLGDVGRRRQLPEHGLARVISAIKHAPEAQGLAATRWTNELVRSFIQREFGICYSYSHINRLIRDHGLQHRMI